MAPLLVLFSLRGIVLASETLPTPSFTWDFSGNGIDDLRPCNTYSLLSSENNTFESGQYSIRAFSPNVTPIYTDIGNNASNLQWRVPFPSGFQVLLGMVDGNNQTGEVKGPFDLNGSAEDGSCLSLNVSSVPIFKVTTNVTDPKACEPVGIFISGGSSPYIATIVIEGTGILSRPMSGKDDIYTWFNVAPPGRRIIFSAEDRVGNLAASSTIVTSAASGDSSTCSLTSYSSMVYHKSVAEKVFFSAWGIPLFIFPCLAFSALYSIWRLVVKLYHHVRGHNDAAAENGDVVPVDTRPHTPVSLSQDDDTRSHHTEPEIEMAEVASMV